MKKIQPLLLFFCAASFLFSCSIEKRHYRPGYHIEWKHKVKTAEIPAAKAVEEKTDDEMEYKKAVMADMSLAQNTAIQDTIITEKKEVNPGISAVHSIAQKQEVKTTAKRPGKKFLALHQPKLNTAKINRLIKTPRFSDTAMSDDARLVFAIIFLLFGLSPFAVLIYNGPGAEFTLDATLWILGILFVVLGVASASGLVWVGWVLLFVAFVYALIAILRKAV